MSSYVVIVTMRYFFRDRNDGNRERETIGPGQVLHCTSLDDAKQLVAKLGHSVPCRTLTDRAYRTAEMCVRLFDVRGKQFYVPVDSLKHAMVEYERHDANGDSIVARAASRLALDDLDETEDTISTT